MVGTNLCSDEALGALVGMAPTDEAGVLARIAALLGDYPRDHRLLFLQGSILVGAGRLIEGYRALESAVEAAPDYAIARFQLGFLQLTSGEAEKAIDTWASLSTLPPDSYLKHFKAGLEALIRDDFAGAIAALGRGIELNHENQPLNRDMRLIIDQCGSRLKPKSTTKEAEVDTATSILLRQQTSRTTHH